MYLTAILVLASGIGRLKENGMNFTLQQMPSIVKYTSHKYTQKGNEYADRTDTASMEYSRFYH
jgi:hypothetical protein